MSRGARASTGYNGLDGLITTNYYYFFQFTLNYPHTQLCLALDTFHGALQRRFHHPATARQNIRQPPLGSGKTRVSIPPAPSQPITSRQRNGIETHLFVTVSRRADARSCLRGCTDSHRAAMARER